MDDRDLRLDVTELSHPKHVDRFAGQRDGIFEPALCERFMFR